MRLLALAALLLSQALPATTGTTPASALPVTTGAVSAQASRVAVGASPECGSRDDVAVSFLEPGGGVYLLSAGRFTRLPGPAGGGFGTALAMADVDGDQCVDVVVGAPETKVAGKRLAGAVYVITARGTKRIVAPRPRADTRFGAAVAASGGIVAIGAPSEGKGGAVYVLAGGTLRRITQDTPGVPGNDEWADRFGTTLAFGPGGLAVGAPLEAEDGPGRQDRARQRPETGAVTVIRDVTARKLTAARLPTPPAFSTATETGVRCVHAGRSLAWSREAGLAVGGSNCGQVQMYGADLKPARTLAHPLGPYTGQTPRLAASNEQIAVLWTTPNPQPATLQTLGADGDRHRTVSGVRLTYNGTRIVLGQFGAVTFLDTRTGGTETIKAPIGGGWDDPIAG
ncbi:hypothetical protein HII36_19460 [Nonomuraea sp. NN258]|uniref:FG-GAP repeat protein n=1 Tax=Nonomuraea antri TaxID=2730852 RepID=UPI0015697587|nr:FG-GAP repeat protein [Nonomuraea antri]NRQ34013.1 hypothetical protein [Nonomuraea antri]